MCIHVESTIPLPWDKTSITTTNTEIGMVNAIVCIIRQYRRNPSITIPSQSIQPHTNVQSLSIHNDHTMIVDHPRPASPTNTSTNTSTSSDYNNNTTHNSNLLHPLLILTRNAHCGNLVIMSKPINIFRVLSNNVNTLSLNTNYLQWKATAHALSTLEVDTIALQETNIEWNTVHKQHIQKLLHQSCSTAKIAVSNSTEISTTSHQCRGTLIATIRDCVSNTA